MGTKCNLCLVAKVLAIVGALNWGLVGAFNYNLVDALLGAWPAVVRIVYILVGLAGLYLLVSLAQCCKKSAGAPSVGGEM